MVLHSGPSRDYGPDTTLTPSFTLFINGDTQVIDGTSASIAIHTTANVPITVANRSSVGYLRVDSYNLNISSGVSGLGYGFNYVDGSLTITPKLLTVSANAISRDYDGGKTASVNLPTSRFSVDGVDDAVTATATLSEFSDKNAGLNKAVSISGIAISGADSSNYVLGSTVASATATINRKNVSLNSITASNKIYDGTTMANVNSPNFSGLVGSEALYVSGNGTFDNKNVGTNNPVTVSNVASLTKFNIVNNPGDWGNYILTTSGPMTTQANITKRSGLRSLNTDLYYDPTLASDLTGKIPRIVTSAELPNYDFSGSINRERAQPNSTPLTAPIADLNAQSRSPLGNDPVWTVENIASLSPQDIPAIPSQWFSRLSASDIAWIPDAAIEKLTTDQLLVLLPRLNPRQLQRLLPQQRRAMLRLSQN